MKYFILLICLFLGLNLQAQDADKKHPEHFIGGVLIGGFTSYFTYTKTDNKVKSWAIGAGAATAVGILKEVIDSASGKDFSGADLGYTALGGAIGASIVFPLKKKKPKEVAYLF